MAQKELELKNIQHLQQHLNSQSRTSSFNQIQTNVKTGQNRIQKLPQMQHETNPLINQQDMNRSRNRFIIKVLLLTMLQFITNYVVYKLSLSIVIIWVIVRTYNFKILSIIGIVATFLAQTLCYKCSKKYWMPYFLFATISLTILVHITGLNSPRLKVHSQAFISTIILTIATSLSAFFIQFDTTNSKHYRIALYITSIITFASYFYVLELPLIFGCSVLMLSEIYLLLNIQKLIGKGKVAFEVDDLANPAINLSMGILGMAYGWLIIWSIITRP